MGFIQNLIAKYRGNKDRYKELEEESRMHEKLETRRLSSDERELNGYLEEDRKKRIKKMLENYRKRKTNEFWHGYKVYKQKNLFTNRENLFKNQNGLLSWD